ncbi:MAG TPA: hypothetical protein VGP82_22295 [Ktedonobacterales bacterium]|nr:hypothetical protein [Ktedonobacterales bacterium]
MDTVIPETREALRTPRAAAIAGIIFSVLLTFSLLIIRLAVSASSRDVGTWLSDPVHKNAVVFALNLIPFAGIAFLWFIGVVRDRMGEHEDRFFATVFLGSGLLFVAMLFASAAVGGVLAATASSGIVGPTVTAVWQFGRQVTYNLLTIYAMRMAGVFMIATATITLRTAIMPRWLALLGYLFALVLLLTVGFTPWIEFLLPIWVLMVSLYILRASLSERPEPAPKLSAGTDA